MDDKEYWGRAKPQWQEMKDRIEQLDVDCQHGHIEAVIAEVILIRDIADELLDLKEEWLNGDF